MLLLQVKKKASGEKASAQEASGGVGKAAKEAAGAAASAAASAAEPVAPSQADIDANKKAVQQWVANWRKSSPAKAAADAAQKGAKEVGKRGKEAKAVVSKAAGGAAPSGNGASSNGATSKEKGAEIAERVKGAQQWIAQWQQNSKSGAFLVRLMLPPVSILSTTNCQRDVAFDNEFAESWCFQIGKLCRFIIKQQWHWRRQ